MTSTRAAAQHKEKMLYSFDYNNAAGYSPEATLTLDAAGNVYGTTHSGGNTNQCVGSPPGCGGVFELSPRTSGIWRETGKFAFDGQDGATPEFGTGLIFDAESNLYGQSSVVFKLTPQPSGVWTETILHKFGQAPDGSGGYASLVSDTAGNLFGTTAFGGAYNYLDGGTVFEVTPNPGGGWTEQILHSFGSSGSQLSWGGNNLYAGLVMDLAGNLYGTAAFGGTGANQVYEGGTVFELTPSRDGRWSEKKLHDFDVTNGSVPLGTLILDVGGNLYGTTQKGGSGSCTGLDGFGCGVVFELIPEAGGGWREKVLHDFSNDGIDGYYPYAGLILDAAGNLYGTTTFGGDGSCNWQYPGCGVVFELIPQKDGRWTEKILHSFANNSVDGSNPYGGLILDASGNLYGTTSKGGAYGLGTVFEIRP
jgi:uncharacterized repeat protein (TIGR03803 family)